MTGGQSDIASGEEEEAGEERWSLQVCSVEGGSQVRKFTLHVFDCNLKFLCLFNSQRPSVKKTSRGSPLICTIIFQHQMYKTCSI